MRTASEEIGAGAKRKTAVTLRGVILAWVIAFAVIGFGSLARDALFPRATQAVDRLAHMILQNTLKTLEASGYDSDDSEMIEGWLSGSTNPTDQGLDNWPFEERPIDPWNNSFVLVTEGDGKLSEVSNLGIYSRGPDGKSESKGNDVDDINTWSAHSAAYYDELRRKATFEKLIRHAIYAALAVAVYLPFRNRLQRT